MPTLGSHLEKSFGAPATFRGRLPDPTYVNPYRTYTRRETDDLFLHLMEVEGVARWRRLAAYSAVRAAGGIAWAT